MQSMLRYAYILKASVILGHRMVRQGLFSFGKGFTHCIDKGWCSASRAEDISRPGSSTCFQGWLQRPRAWTSVECTALWGCLEENIITLIVLLWKCIEIVVVLGRRLNLSLPAIAADYSTYQLYHQVLHRRVKRESLRYLSNGWRR